MKHRCALECDIRRDTCYAWCLLESSCLLNNFLISPQDAPDHTDFITCYTKRKRGNHLLKATATSSPANNQRIASILTKGIYNYNFCKTSAAIRKDSNPAFMLFEFPTEVLIKTILVRPSSNPNESPSSQTEIRIGCSMSSPTDFSQLDLIGTFDNPKIKEKRIFLVTPPKMAKYLTILETDQTALTLTFMEVFST